MPSWYRIDSKRVLLSCLYLPFQGDGEEARACSTASAGLPRPAHMHRLAHQRADAGRVRAAAHRDQRDLAPDFRVDQCARHHARMID